MAAVARRACLAAGLFFVALIALAQVAVPPMTARVTDVTGTLNSGQRDALEQRLAAFEGRKGTQIAVLIVPTVKPETIDQFGIRVGEQRKIGRKGIDDGAILIVAIKDRELRIEVGYGLEGALPDAVAKRIIAEDIVPHFKQGDFYGGIAAGLTRMIAVAEGEALPAPAARRSSGQGVGGGGVEGLLILGFMLIFVVGGVIRSIFGRFLGSGVIGAIGGAAGWLMLGSAAAAVVVAVVAGVLSLSGGLGGAGRRHGGWYTGGLGGFGGGGGGFGGWGGGGGGGGSWGGGGGGFGGGGASGRW